VCTYLCGCRPIIFDKPHYTDWFDDWAITIPEDDNIEQSLIEILKHPATPVTEVEITQVELAFDWSVIAGEFWDRVIGKQVDSWLDSTKDIRQDRTKDTREAGVG